MSPQACHQRQPLSQGSWLGPNRPPGGHCSRLLITSRALCQDLGIVTSIWVYIRLSTWTWNFWVMLSDIVSLSLVGKHNIGKHDIVPDVLWNFIGYLARHQYMPALSSISYEISFDNRPDINICRCCLRYRMKFSYDIWPEYMPVLSSISYPITNKNLLYR